MAVRESGMMLSLRLYVCLWAVLLYGYSAAVMMISIRSPSGITDCPNERTGPWPSTIT